MVNEEVTFVIPTIREKVYTLDSIPDGYPYFIEREGNLDEARNRGVQKAETDIVIICDDDVRFTKDFLDSVLSMMDESTLVGLEDHYPFEKWCIGRFLCFYKKDWEKVGGFDESRNIYGGDDTDFCIRMEKSGVKIVKLPLDSIEHVYGDKKVPTKSVANTMLYLLKKHPKEMIPKIVKLMARKMTGRRV